MKTSDDRNPLPLPPLADLIFVLAVGLLLAWFATATPRAAGAGAARDRFAAGRALLDIERMAAVAHPNGSPQNAAVRATLVARIVQLGVAPTIRHADGLRAWGGRSAKTYSVDDVVARVAGTNPSAPALLVLSHYDSVPRSPGAADDMASVAAALEMIRLMKLRPPPYRDVVFVFTDGEEPGLIGAQALFGDAGLTVHTGFVINMDVRGGGGRALMFQTGRKAGDAVRLYAAHARLPVSNSLAAFLYDKMPNDTDFSVALAHGVAGLNFAFIGRPGLYHTPTAVPRAVEPGAVQSLGDQVWPVVQALAFAASLPQPSVAPVWFDVFGRFVAIYPPGLGWLPIVAGGALLPFAAWRQRRGSGVSVGAVGIGAAQTLLATLLTAALLYGYGRLAVNGYYQALGQALRTEAVIAVVALACSLFVFRAAGAADGPAARWLGAVALAWLLALAMQLAAAPTAFLAAWPCLLATGALALCSGARKSALEGWIAMSCCALALGFLLEIWHLLVLAVALVKPVVGAALLPFALAALSPFLQVETRARFGLRLRRAG